MEIEIAISSNLPTNLIRSYFVRVEKKRKKDQEKQPEDDVPRKQTCKGIFEIFILSYVFFLFCESVPVAAFQMFLASVVFPSRHEDGDGEAAHDGGSLHWR